MKELGIYIAVVAIVLLGGRALLKKKPEVVNTVKATATPPKIDPYPLATAVINDPDRSVLAEKLAKMRPLIEAGKTDRQIWEATGIPRGTVNGYRRKYFTAAAERPAPNFIPMAD